MEIVLIEQNGCDIHATHRWVVYPGNESYPLDENTTVIFPGDILKKFSVIPTEAPSFAGGRKL